VTSDEVRALLDQQEVRDVLARLARSIDRLDFELMAECYHPDGTDERHGVRRTVPEFIAWVEPVLRSMDSTLHQLTTQLVVVDGDEATAETYCVARHVLPPDGRVWFAHLRYHDDLVRLDGRWRLRHRSCAYEPGMVDPVTQELVPAERLGGSRDRSDPAYRSGVRRDAGS
jgi:hypothetical protein